MPTRVLLRHLTVLVAFAAAASVSASDTRKPLLVRCKGFSSIGCGSDGVCIADAVRDRFPITFDLKANRYSSARGNGRITQQWDMDDGRHAISVSSPPASGEFVFAKDWRTASAGGSITYACEMLKD